MNSIISVFIGKGGGGPKTTTVLSLAGALAKRGISVCVIDTDGQCNSTDVLTGLDPANNLLDVYLGTKEISDCVHSIPWSPNMYCIPNSTDLPSIEPLLIKQGETAFTLLKQRIFDYCQANFQVTLIDNPPNLGIFVINSLAVATHALIPTVAGSRFSLSGLKVAIKFIKELQDDGLNPDLTLLGILATKIDLRSSISKQYLEQINSTFPDFIFKNHIPVNTDFLYAEDKKQTIHQWKAKARGAKAYDRVANEIIKKLGLKQ